MRGFLQSKYEAVMGSNPAHFHEGAGGGPNHPVEMVSWFDAVEFCKRLSLLPAEKQAWRVYRLPTEAEWEYACRAGTATPFSFGTVLSADQANFNGNLPQQGTVGGSFRQKTTAVGYYPGNPFGLFDMHGNVWEWCADWYGGRYYEVSPEKDPPGPAGGQYRVIRGGAWYNASPAQSTSGSYCRSAYRNKAAPDMGVEFVGFRIVLAPEATGE
jgi:formylglycine-generating enzyme required for sulfatase activity